MSEVKFKNRYRIPSARASWHNYRQGIYFVTICTQNREHYFGEIKGCETNEPTMVLSDIGRYADACWQSIPSHFPHVNTTLWVIMPNHIHGILVINPFVETQNFASLRTDKNDEKSSQFGPQSKNLASVIRGFKIGVTKFARKHHILFEWQPRFHDHIIRDTDELNNVSYYIENNVAKWKEDVLYGE